eukprot:TRINITY_DN79777_c0_g1_i1.p1 TRINITY_DN79777_c0_g1~~TRINITY_DN79777_c0_g1_i1.p1  ORF type:complete len:213 (+),score=11.06 TRINITY_DN79777_c0_g1_i1:1-639(+)
MQGSEFLSRRCKMLLSSAVFVSVRANPTTVKDTALVDTATAAAEAVESGAVTDAFKAIPQSSPSIGEPGGDCSAPPHWCMEGTHIPHDGKCTTTCSSSEFPTVPHLMCSMGALDPPGYGCKRYKQWYGGVISLASASTIFFCCVMGLIGVMCSGLATVKPFKRHQPSYGPGLNDEELEPLSMEAGAIPINVQPETMAEQANDADDVANMPQE